MLVDLLASLVCLIMAAKKEWAISMVYLAQLFVVTVYFYTDVVIILYGLKLNLQMPMKLKVPVPMAMIGFGSSLKAEFVH